MVNQRLHGQTHRPDQGALAQLGFTQARLDQQQCQPFGQAGLGRSRQAQFQAIAEIDAILTARQQINRLQGRAGARQPLRLDLPGPTVLASRSRQAYLRPARVCQA